MKRKNIDMIITALPFVEMAVLGLLYIAIGVMLETHPGMFSQLDLIEFYSMSTFLGIGCSMILWSLNKLCKSADRLRHQQ